jgi:hypothetical protein
MHSFPKLCMYIFLSNINLFACTFFAELEVQKEVWFLYENHNNGICPRVLQS